MKKLVFLAVLGIFLFSILAVAVQPVNAEIRETCEDPPDGPEVCTVDMDPEDYCLTYLPSVARAGTNPKSVWDPNTETCYYQDKGAACFPHWNMLTDFFKIYTADGPFEDETGEYIWTNGQFGCAKFNDPEDGFLTPSAVRVYDGGVGSAKLRDGEFDYEYGTCSGKCRISTTKLTHTAERALPLMPYKIYKKAYVTILNQAGELSLGQFRLCYTFNYTEKRDPTYYRFNGEDWRYVGGFWNANFTKFCLNSSTYGNYVLVDRNQVARD